MSTASAQYKMIFSDYYAAYLEHQAVNHPVLRHSEVLGGRVFTMLNLEETFGGLRTGSKEKDYIMRGIWPSHRISDEYTEGEVRKYWEAGFIIAKYHKDGTLNSVQDAIASSEKLANEIIEKMIADSLNGHLLFYHSLDATQNIKVDTFAMMAPNWSGVRVMFDFWNFWRNCIYHESAPDWLDGGETPFPVDDKMIFSNYYVTYLKHQAINHPGLLHDDAKGSRVFNMLNLEETFGDLRTGAKEKDYIMRGIWPSHRISDEYTEGEARKYWEGGFIIAKYHKDGTLRSIREAIAGSEQIADEIIEKMITDSLNGHPVFYHSLDAKQNIRISTFAMMAPNWSGVRVMFDFWNFWRNCVDHESAPDWLDGGLTPLPGLLLDDFDHPLADDENTTLVA